eukprot:scaffold529_cov322-Pavlova_lutheri.AAC.3
MGVRRTNNRAVSVVCSANGLAQAVEKAGKAATVSLGAGALLASVSLRAAKRGGTFEACAIP